MTGTQFTEWRKRLGLTKAAAAEVLGISRNMPHRYESGTVPIPRHIALACSAVALNVPAYGSPAGS